MNSIINSKSIIDKCSTEDLNTIVGEICRNNNPCVEVGVYGGRVFFLYIFRINSWELSTINFLTTEAGDVVNLILGHVLKNIEYFS